eukprot:1150141-Pelagomonas_calceolata.AAC.1
MPCIFSPMKRTIFQYRTGTLYSQTHAVRSRRSTNLLCPLPGCHQSDSALHMLSGCQNHIISSMETERHNVAGRMIIKDLSKSPCSGSSCWLVSMRGVRKQSLLKVFRVVGLLLACASPLSHPYYACVPSAMTGHSITQFAK